MVEALLFASAEPLGRGGPRRRGCRRAPTRGHPATTLAASMPARGVNLVRVAGKWAFRTAGDLSSCSPATWSSSESCPAPRWRRWRSSPTTSRSRAPRSRRSAASRPRRARSTLLLETGWVRLRGRRRAPGRPVTYGTTPAFLDHFGLDAVGDLPGLDELKGAGFLEGRVPPGLSRPGPDDADTLRDDEDPLDADDDLPPLGQGRRARRVGNDGGGRRPAAGARSRQPRWGQRGTARRRRSPRDLAFEDIVQTYGATRRPAGRVARRRAGRARLPARAIRAAARPRCCASPPASRRRAPGRVLLDGQEVDRSARLRAAGEARHRPDVPGLCAVSASDDPATTCMFGLHGPARRRRQEASARRALSRVGLERYSRRSIRIPCRAASSSASRSRASIAPRPGVLLMDEPFSNLDRRMRDAVRDETVAILRETPGDDRSWSRTIPRRRCASPTASC